MTEPDREAFPLLVSIGIGKLPQMAHLPVVPTSRPSSRPTQLQILLLMCSIHRQILVSLEEVDDCCLLLLVLAHQLRDARPQTLYFLLLGDELLRHLEHILPEDSQLLLEKPYLLQVPLLTLSIFANPLLNLLHLLPHLVRVLPVGQGVLGLVAIDDPLHLPVNRVDISQQMLIGLNNQLLIGLRTFLYLGPPPSHGDSGRVIPVAAAHGRRLILDGGDIQGRGPLAFKHRITNNNNKLPTGRITIDNINVVSISRCALGVLGIQGLPHVLLVRVPFHLEHLGPALEGALLEENPIQSQPEGVVQHPRYNGSQPFIGQLDARVGVDLNQPQVPSIIDHEVIPENLKIFILVLPRLRTRHQYTLVLVARNMQARTPSTHRGHYVLLYLGEEALFGDEVVLVKETYGENVALLELTVVCCPFLDGIVCQMGEKTAGVEGKFLA